jgi:hypothetical protein
MCSGLGVFFPGDLGYNGLKFWYAKVGDNSIVARLGLV